MLNNQHCQSAEGNFMEQYITITNIIITII